MLTRNWARLGTTAAAEPAASVLGFNFIAVAASSCSTTARIHNAHAPPRTIAEPEARCSAKAQKAARRRARTVPARLEALTFVEKRRKDEEEEEVENRGESSAAGVRHVGHLLENDEAAASPPTATGRGGRERGRREKEREREGGRGGGGERKRAGGGREGRGIERGGGREALTLPRPRLHPPVQPREAPAAPELLCVLTKRIQQAEGQKVRRPLWGLSRCHANGVKVSCKGGAVAALRGGSTDPRWARIQKMSC